MRHQSGVKLRSSHWVPMSITHVNFPLHNKRFTVSCQGAQRHVCLIFIGCLSYRCFSFEPRTHLGTPCSYLRAFALTKRMGERLQKLAFLSLALHVPSDVLKKDKAKRLLWHTLIRRERGCLVNECLCMFLDYTTLVL